MSRGSHSDDEGRTPPPPTTVPGEEEEDAFIDLEDPNNEILNEAEMPEVDASDNEEETPAPPANGEVDENEEQAEVVDLNEVPDREPERDDAMCSYTAQNHKPLHTIAAHPSQPSLFATGGESDEVYVLQLHPNPDSATQVTEKAILRGHSDTINVLAFSPDGQWLACGGLDAVVSIWSTSNWELVHTLRDLSGEVWTLLWHPSSLVLVAGAEDAQAAMWNVTRGTLAVYFAGHRGPITCAAWTPDLKRLLTGSGDGSVMVFSPKTGEQEVSVARGLSPDTAPVTAVCFVNEDQCVVGCEDGTMHIISLRAARAVHALEEVHQQAIESLRIASTPTTMSANSNHNNNNNSHNNNNNNNNMNSNSGGAALLLSASCDCCVAVWNTADFTLRALLRVGESVIPAIWAHSHLIVAGCGDGEVRVWDGRSLDQQPLSRFMGHRRMIMDLTVSGDVIATASDDGTARFFQLSL